MSERKSTTYNLYSTERIYPEETLISYYFQPNKKVVKNFSPIDIDGERYRLNLQSGELTEYKKKDIERSASASLRRTNISINMLLSMNNFDWFWTLTFDKDRIDRTNDKIVLDCYKKYINNIKKQYPNFRYMCFPERHKDGCIHFHLVTAGLTVKQMGLVNSGKVCCSWAKDKGGICSKKYFEQTKDKHQLKETDGEPIYNITTFAYGYTTVSRICSRERCNSYVKKYVEKDLGSMGACFKRFYYSSNLNVPDVVKRLVGADFDAPEDIRGIKGIIESQYVKNAKGEPYINPFNVLQIKVDNHMKKLIDTGVSMLSEEESAMIGLKFDSYQESLLY